VELERSLFNEFLKSVFISKQKQSCKVILLKDGLPSIIVQIEAIIFNNGQECRAVVQNITEIIQKEKLSHQLEFIQVARANSMGELASAIAHEINQPFCVIVNYINGCMRRLESNNYDIAEIIDVMRMTTKQIELVGEIVHHMKNILRQDVTYYKPVSINEIAQAAASQIQKETHYDLTILLELELAHSIPLVNADYIQIEVVILNLLRNGLESIYKTHIEKPKLILRTELQKNMIIVSVLNNGTHYSLEEEMHLFEPCFTTKKSGMGMGLSISRTIIEAHSGHLSSYKIPVKGVCFQFSLPLYWKNNEFHQ
jgi:C4-dicarboxylate-specific signal transduction histidine kinase